MKMVLGVVRPGRAMDFGPTRVESMLDEGGGGGGGVPMDIPQTGLGLLKTVWIAYWTKISHEKLFACYCLVVE